MNTLKVQDVETANLDLELNYSTKTGRKTNYQPHWYEDNEFPYKEAYW